MAKASKDVKLPACNLYLVGSGLDKNGNKVAKFKFANSRAFSIQTNANLPKTGTILRGLKTAKDMQGISASDLSTICGEVVPYIKEYGTDTQKKKLKTS